MSILDLDPGDPNNWYQSPHLGLFPVSPAGYGGGISAACYCTHSSHPHSSPSYPPPPSQTIINGYVFPHQFPSTHTYHSPHSDPNPWIYPSISQHHSYGPSVSSVHSPFIFTKTMTTPPIYHSAPSIQTFQSPLVPTFMPQLPITYPKPLSLNRKSFRRFRHRVAMAAKERIAKKTRNPYMFHGVGKYSRSKMYHKRGLWAIKAKNGGAFPRHNSKAAGEIMEELGQIRVGRKTLIDTSEPPAVQSGTPPTTGNTSSFSFAVTEPTDHSISTQASAGSSLPPSIEATGFVGDISLDIPAVAVNLAGINESAHDVDPNASTGSQIVTEINVGVQISEDVLLPEYVLPAEVSVNTENGHNWIEMVIDLEKLGVLDIGPPVVEALSRKKFIGLSEGFSFLNGLSHSSTFQIVNVISTGENVMGYWTPENEFVRNLNCKTAMNSSFSTSNSSLGSIIWPGDSTSTPKGWQIPTSGTKLKILLPVQSGFKEFTNVADDSNFEQHIMMKEEFYKEQLTLVRFCRSGHFDKAKEVFVQILKRWKSKVTAEIAGEENTKKPNFVLKEGLKLDNKMVVCSIDTQSRSHLLSWFILFFELGNCETMKETPPYCRKASAEISLVTQSLVSQVFTAIISSPQYFRASFYGVLYDLIKLYVVIYIAFIDNAGNLLPDDSFGIMIGNDKLFYEYMNVLAKMLLRSVSKEQLMSSNVSIMDTIVAALCGESIKMDGVGISFLIWLLAIRSTKFKREAASIIHIWASLIDHQMVDWNVIYALMYEERFIIEFSEQRKDRELEALKCVSLVIEVHGSAMRRGLSNLVLRNAVVNVYGQRGYKVHAYQMFKLIESKDVVSWTSMISCYVHNGPASEALELCQLMKEVNVKPDFQAYGMHGHGKEAIDLFKRMEDQKIVPDHIMFWAQVFYIKGQMETDDGLANQLGKICLLIAIAINQLHLNEAAALYKGMDTSEIIQLHSTNWLVQPEHEHCKWSAAIFLALISSCLHVTNHKQKFENIARLVEVLCSSKSILVKGAGGIGLGFSCQDLLTWANASDNSSMETDLDKLLERDLLGDIAKALLFMIFWVRGLDAISKIKDVISWVLHMNGMVQVSFHHLLQLVITLFIFYLELFSGVVSSIICNSHYGNTFSYICYLVGNLSHMCQATQLQNQRQKQNNALGENERSLLLFQRVLFLCFISELAKGDRQLQIFLPYVIMLELGEAFTTWELLHTRGGCSDRECPGVLTETNRCEDVVVFKGTDVGGDQSKLHAHNLSPMSYKSDSRHAVELGNGASLLLHYFFCNYHINARGHQLGAEMISSDVPLLSVDDLANQLVEVLDLYRLKEVLSLGGDLDDEARVSFGRQLRLEVKPVL